MGEHVGQPPVFRERPTELLVADAYRFGAIPLAIGAVFALMGVAWPALVLLGLGLFVAFFFRNPERLIPGDEDTVVSPADGRVLEVGEIELEDGSTAVRIGIFLSVFNVHVNRIPLAGRVIAVERSGTEFLAAFNRDAETRNVRCTLLLDNERGTRFRVTQITGLVARRIVCHPQPGEWIHRGERYGLIRFGSRTDVVLPPDARPCVAPGDRVRGGSSVIAELAGAA